MANVDQQPSPAPALELTGSPHIIDWLAELQISLAFTTYQTCLDKGGQGGSFIPVAFCPGYLWGLTFWQDFAIVGLSKPRSGDHTFSGLALDERLAAKGASPRCGLMIDLRTGTIVHWLRLEGLITELYDVQVLPRVQRPMAVGFQSEEIQRLITLDPLGTLPQPEPQIQNPKL